MSIRRAGDIIREARLSAGMSQETLSEGICSLVALSNIEKGLFGVSPFTFQLLMQKTGHPCEEYPIFENRNDFDCFILLREINSLISCFQLDEAYQKLLSVKALDYNKNLLYYQEWLYLYSALQYYSGTADHSHIFQVLYKSIDFFHPEYLSLNLKRCVFSTTDLEMLILYASELLRQSDFENCFIVYSQLKTYIDNSPFIASDLESLNRKLNILYINYLLCTKDYNSAYSICDEFIRSASFPSLRFSALEIKLLFGIASFFLGKKENTRTILSELVLFCQSLQSPFFYYMKELLSFYGISLSVKEDLINSFPSVSLNEKDFSFPCIDFVRRQDLNDGVFDYYSQEVLTIGKLIKELRKEQKLSQPTLCEGLCSKSMLSKIENNQLNPGIILSVALLHRLGLSVYTFSFFGNHDETRFFEILNLFYSMSDLYGNYSEIIEELSEISDRLNLPYVTQARELIKLKNSPKSTDTYEAALSALKLTHPDFDFNQILNYRLTDVEFYLIIIMMGCINVTPYSPFMISYMQQLLLYKDNATFYIGTGSNFYPLLLFYQHDFLYRNKMFSTMEYLFNPLDRSVYKRSPRMWGQLLFYQCQALGELGKSELAKQYGEYAISVLSLFELSDWADALKQALMEDFQIEIGSEVYVNPL